MRVGAKGETVLGSGHTEHHAVESRATLLRDRRGAARRSIESASTYGILVVLVLVAVGGEIKYPGFLDLSNLSNMITQNASVGLVAIAMTFVIIGQGFDLSVGGIYALASVVYAQVSSDHTVLLGAAVATIVGAVAGLINASIVAVVKVNPFVATLGSGFVFAGLAYIYSNSVPITADKPGFQWFGTGSIVGVPVAIWAMIVFAALATFVLNMTIYGRNVSAVGGNMEACRLAGIRTGMVRGSTYVLTGAVAAVGGIMLTAETGVGQADNGTALPLTAIAMVIIGGTSLAGGEGAIWRTIVGFLLIAGVSNLLQTLGIGSDWQTLTTGAILVGAVALDVLTRRISRST